MPSLLAEAGTVRFTRAPSTATDDPALVGLDVTDAVSQFAVLYFSRNTGLPVRLVETYEVTLLWREIVTRAIRYEDFRNIEGLMPPFRFATEGGLRTIQVDRYILNARIPDEIFDRPSSADALERLMSFTPRG